MNQSCNAAKVLLTRFGWYNHFRHDVQPLERAKKKLQRGHAEQFPRVYSTILC